jgi:iron complex outermembrane recepter protein
MRPGPRCRTTRGCRQQFGAVALRPERSVNGTLGLAWRFAAHSSATVDLYQIRIRDRITPTGSLQSPLVSAFLTGQNITDIASVTFLTNALDTRSRGLDLVLSHETDLLGGTLRLSAAFNRNYLHEDGLRNSSAALARIDPSLSLSSPTVLVPLEYGSPATKLILGADWSDDRWGTHLAATRFGSMYAYSFDFSPPAVLNGYPVQRYEPAWAVDIEGHYNVGRDVTVAIGGTDVFNRYPDQTTAGGSYGGTFPYNYANPLGINGAYYYARLTLRFGR